MMRRFPALGALLMIPATAALLAVGGCSGGDPKKPNPPATAPTTPSTTPAEGKKTTEAKGAKETLTAKTDGTVKGVVKTAQTDPLGSLKEKMKAHADKDHCLAAPEDQQIDQQWIVGKDGGVANAIVYLKAPDGKAFGVTDEVKANYKEPAVLDQPYCVFVPHVVALYPDAGQVLHVKNSAKVPHNTKIIGDALKNPTKNVTIAPGGKADPFTIKHQKTPLDVGCDLHTWMNAKVKTFDQPYFAVTDKDGNFEIKNVPSGVELTVMTWHELAGDQEAQKATFKAGDNSPLELKLAKK